MHHVSSLLDVINVSLSSKESSTDNRDKERWSGRQDLNLRPLAPHASALPGCATPRTRGQDYHESSSMQMLGENGAVVRTVTLSPTVLSTLWETLHRIHALERRDACSVCCACDASIDSTDRANDQSVKNPSGNTKRTMALLAPNKII